MSVVSSEAGGLTNRKIFLSTVGFYKTAVGTAVLSVPKAMANTGTVLFPFLLFGFAFVAQFGCYLVARTLDRINEREMDPATVGEYCLGKFGYWLAVILCLLDPWGSTITFFSMISDILHSMLKDISGKHTDFIAEKGFVIACLAVLVFPLMLYEKITHMDWVNILGCVALVAFVIGIVVNTAEHGQGLSGAPKGEMDKDAVVALTVIAFAFDGCQVNFFPYYRNLPAPLNGEKKGKILSMMTTFANFGGAASYLAVAYLAYSCYRDETDDDLLNNFDNSSPVYVIIKLTFAISLLFTIPITLFECTSVLTKNVFDTDSRKVNAALNFGLIATAALIASYVKSVYSAFGYVGATTATAWTMVLPPLFYIFTVRRQANEAKQLSLINQEDVESQPLITDDDNSEPIIVQILAWIMLITGCACVPFFVYVTATA